MVIAYNNFKLLNRCRAGDKQKVLEPIEQISPVAWQNTMHLTLEIPDDLVGRLSAAGDLSRRALEAFAADQYKHNRLTKPELRIETSYELDGFLKAHDIWIEYTNEDAQREHRTFERLGF